MEKFLFPLLCVLQRWLLFRRWVSHFPELQVLLIFYFFPNSFYWCLQLYISHLRLLSSVPFQCGLTPSWLYLCASRPSPEPWSASLLVVFSSYSSAISKSLSINSIFYSIFPEFPFFPQHPRLTIPLLDFFPLLYFIT